MNLFVVVINGKDFFIDSNEEPGKFFESEKLKNEIEKHPFYRDRRVGYGVVENNSVPVYKVTIKNGEMVKMLYKTIEFPTKQNPMDEETYADLSTKLLTGIPEEFHSVLRCLVYDEKHSFGYAEMFEKLNCYIEKFFSPIKNFENRIRSEYPPIRQC